MGRLINSQEMFVRTVYELNEEGVPPLPARLVDNLSLSFPTVRGNLDRLKRAGWVVDGDDRCVELTSHGLAQAIAVVRKHRLAECLLVYSLGLSWMEAHDEACRLEHVMSEDVERRMFDMLGHPTTSPFGTPIPGLEKLGGSDVESSTDYRRLASLPAGQATNVLIRQLPEPLQAMSAQAKDLVEFGLIPGSRFVAVVNQDSTLVSSAIDSRMELPRDVANMIRVEVV
jgi:DtxR family transcriptional regulator, Mn-dependent transcriptional regulator